MADEALDKALEKTRQAEITTVGRTSGRRISLPVWFVRRADALYVLPVGGSRRNWYRNVRQARTIGVAAGHARHASPVTAITDPAAVKEVVESFRAAYGNRDVEAYCPNPDVAVEVPLA